MQNNEEDRPLRPVTCPNCHEEFEADIVDALHEGDAAVGKLFHGSFNLILCNACGVEFRVETPVVFRNAERNLMIFFNPALAKIPWRVAEKQMSEVIAAGIKDLPPELRPEFRLVFDLPAFVEKVAIALEDLDDRALELLKVKLFRSEPGMNARTHRLLFDFTESGSDKLAFDLFSRRGGQAERKIAIEKITYDELVQAQEEDEPDLDLNEFFPGAWVAAERHTGA
jgi:hypothetical protein